jgi:hypothetical protein
MTTTDQQNWEQMKMDVPDVVDINDAIDFGQALFFVKSGWRISRANWNGANMWVVLQKGYPDGIAINSNTAKATGFDEGSVHAFRPYLMMFTADAQFVPWVASQSDILAEDWYLVNG